MPALKDTIAALFERAASAPTAEATVARGLKLKARYVDGMRQLLLARPDVQPSDVEEATCAKHGGFDAYQLTKGPLWRCLVETGTSAHEKLIEQALEGALGDPKDAKIGLTGQVCGTCANGTPGQYPNEVDCQLGWDTHDNLRDSKGRPTQAGHGGLPLPILTPGHTCVAVLGGNRPGWVDRA